MHVTPTIRLLALQAGRAARSRLLGHAVSIALASTVALVASLPAQAQNPFAPRLHVNDRVITEYDVQQRARFLEILGVNAADMEQEAIDRLTEEAVQMFHARRQGLRAEREEIAEGMAEFAARAEMDVDSFLDALAQEGVEEGSFIEFVEAGIVWRQMVRARFLPRVEITSGEIDRALDVSSIRGTQRVLLSEIFLPDDPEFAEAVANIVPQIFEITSFDEFSEAARQVSIAGSAEQGGRLEWLPIENLPGQVRALVRDASVGQILGPIEVPGAIGIFQLRGLDSTRDIPADRVQVDYRRLLLPGGRSETNMARLQEIRARVDLCNDLNLFARDLPEEALTEEQALVQDLPQEVALELARLNPREISANMVSGDNLVVLMLCSHTLQFDEPPSRAQVRDQLRNQRLNQLADNWIAELIAEADIRRP